MNPILDGFAVPPRPAQPRMPGVSTARLDLIGDITVESALPLFRAISAARKDSIELDIDSRGGNALCSLALFELLITHPHRVVANIVGRASSGAAIVAMGADLRRIIRGGRVLLHATSVTLENATATELRSFLVDVEAIGAMTDEIFTAATGRAWDHGEGQMIFDARAAIAAGLAHEFTASGEV